jgi:hypothetical protein
LNHLFIVDGKLKIDVDTYSTGELSAYGAGSSTGGSGGGLIKYVYDSTDLNGIYNDTDYNNTFNAYTINEIYKTGYSNKNRIIALESGTYNKTETDARIAAVVNSAPSTLDTLNELANALGNDPNFATTTANLIGTKLSLSGGTLSGNLFIPSNVGIIQNQASTSNYTTAIKWYKGGVSQNTYDPQIGQYNTGGTGTGAITILPYPTNIEPWNGTVGLYLTGAVIKFNNNTIYHSGNFTNLNQLTTRNFSDLQNKPTTIDGYQITDGVKNNGGLWNISIKGRDNTVGNALLQSGSGRIDNESGSTWLFWDTLGGSSAPWGIKHNQASNYIEYYGNGLIKTYIDLNNGYIYTNGKANTGDQDLSNLSTYTYVDNTFLKLAGGTMTGGISYSTAAGNTKTNNYISLGGGYSNSSGKYGLKVLTIEQPDCVMGMGIDLGGSPFTNSIAFTKSGTNGGVDFVYNTATNFSTYTRVGRIDQAGNFSVSGTVTASTFSGALSGNASTATKLATVRTIWGQNFDGSGNVSGTFTSGIISIGDSNEIWSTGAPLYINHSSRGGQNIHMCTGNGNVGIGTTAPAYKLDVAGTLRTTGAVTLGSTLYVAGAITVNHTINAYKNTPNGTAYNELGIQVYSNDGSPVGIGFHRGGYSQTILEHNGNGLTIRNSTIGTGALGDLYLGSLVASGTVTAPTFIVSANNLITTHSGYLGLKTSGNEMTIGGATSMYVNYRAASGGTPTLWRWMIGDGTNFADFDIGALRASGIITAQNGIITDYYGSSWLTMATRVNQIRGDVNASATQAHSLYCVKNSNGDAIAFGGLGVDTGFYGFTAARIANGTNGTDWSTAWNVSTGMLNHTGSFYTGGYISSNSYIRANSRIFVGYDSNASNAISCSGWFRSNGTTGWINDTYGGGIYMADSTYVRVYNNKAFKVTSTASDSINTDGGVLANGVIRSNSNITAGGELTAYVASDRNLKKNIKPIDNALNVINKLEAVSYNWNDKAKKLNENKTEQKDFGLIAQDVESIVPEIVHNIHNDKYKAIDYIKLIPFLIKAIQEQQIEIDNLREKIDVNNKLKN